MDPFHGQLKPMDASENAYMQRSEERITEENNYSEI